MEMAEKRRYKKKAGKKVVLFCLLVLVERYWVKVHYWQESKISAASTSFKGASFVGTQLDAQSLLSSTDPNVP